MERSKDIIRSYNLDVRIVQKNVALQQTAKWVISQTFATFWLDMKTAWNKVYTWSELQ